MKRLTSLVCLSLALFAGLAVAADASRDFSGYVPADGKYAQTMYGGAVLANKAAADTVYLLGGPGTNLGKFQDNTGTLPQEQDWFGVDLTVKTLVRWNISGNNAALLDPVPATNLAMWCGEAFDACTPGDPAYGYGNTWDEYLDWLGIVPNNTVPTSVTVTARLNHDCEPDYDYLYFEVERETGMEPLVTYTGANIVAGVFVPVNFSSTFTVNVVDYVGAGHNQVHLRWHAVSDGAYSDEDCNYPSSGHSQVDNVRVSYGVVQQTYDDFQPAKVQNWNVGFPPSCGDFSKVWPRLADADPCNGNNTPQFAFIDDGLVVPGTGGRLGQTWTYGPSSFIHNLVGGLAGEPNHVANEVWSPELTWPTGSYDGATFSFDVYRHLPLTNGFFYVWHVRSSDDGGTTWSGWQDDNFVYYSNAADYLRVANNVTSRLVAGRNRIQLAIGANDYGWNFGPGYDGIDGTPAPYFDNVRLVAYSFGGPGITARDIDAFQDDFPDIGTIDYGNLAANYVRVDAARNISPRAHSRNDPGDTMFMTIAAVRTGSAMAGRPEMHIRMKANPLFNGLRALPAGFSQTGNLITGVKLADTTYAKPSYAVVPNVWNWDLPDTGFFFPGDYFQYFIKAQDVVGANVGTSYLPADTAGFSFLPGHPDYQSLRYPSFYKNQGLPTLFTAVANSQPRILFWNDFADRGGENEWFGALDNLGYKALVDYDVYYTNGPSSGVGNGLGGRAAASQLAGYQTMLYTAGDLGSYTISNGDYAQDPGQDVTVMNAWLTQGGHNLFMTGDDLEADLNASGAATVAFRNNWLSVIHRFGDLRPQIGNQTSPWVKPIALNGILTKDYIAFGGCQIFNDFDAVEVTGTTAQMIAEFTSPTGGINAYTYAAAVYNHVASPEAEIIYMPYDFMFIYDKVAHPAPVRPVRADVLREILLFFGHLPSGTATGVTPDAGVFAAKNFPNPFNPSTKIEFNLPRAGQVELKVYNVRGELVKTLLNENMESGLRSVVWDGTNSTGQSVSSGVYFYSLKAGSFSKIEKMTLVK